MRDSHRFVSWLFFVVFVFAFAATGCDSDEANKLDFDIHGPSIMQPLYMEGEQQIIPSELAAGDRLGYSVDASGDRTIVGAYYAKTKQGAAYIYESGESAPTELYPYQDCVDEYSGQLGSIKYAGRGVAISGDYAVVGAYYSTNISAARVGAAFVYHFNGSSWDCEEALVGSESGANFGFSVGISGDTLVVGSYSGDGVVTNSGTAYVYERSGADWTGGHELRASDGLASDYLGYSVSISGDTIVAGAWGDDTSGINSHGSAYIFEKPSNGWATNSQDTKVEAPTRVYNDRFGFSVSISGNVMTAGAYYREVGAFANAGAAFVFHRPYNGDFTYHSILEDSDAGASDYFGRSVDVKGSTVVVGSYGYDLPSKGNAGSALLYKWDDDTQTWSEETRLTASDAASYDYFGISVAAEENLAVAGAYGHDEGGMSYSGAAYMYTWQDAPQRKLVAIDSRTDGGRMGSAVDIDGNVVAVGAFREDKHGTVTVFRCDTIKCTEEPVEEISGLEDDAEFGRSVAVQGDTLLVGAPKQDADHSGLVYVFERNGTSGVWENDAAETFDPGGNNARCGYALAFTGDLAVTGC